MFGRESSICANTESERDLGKGGSVGALVVAGLTHVPLNVVGRQCFARTPAVRLHGNGSDTASVVANREIGFIVRSLRWLPPGWRCLRSSSGHRVGYRFEAMSKTVHDSVRSVDGAPPSVALVNCRAGLMTSWAAAVREFVQVLA